MINRLFTILLGYAAAAVSAWTIPAAYELSALVSPGQDLPPIGLVLEMLAVAGMLLVLASGVLLLPALAVIAITEFFSMRRLIAYLAFGVVVMSGYGLVIVWQSVDSLSEKAPLPMAMTIGGALAGFVYWKIAGRDAGKWREA